MYIHVFHCIFVILVLSALTDFNILPPSFYPVFCGSLFLLAAGGPGMNYKYQESMVSSY